jgi:putative salt-induced outer membrane protein
MRSTFSRSTLVLAAAASFTTPATAQVKSKPDGEWRGTIGLGASGARGNTTSTNATFNADAIRQTTTDKLGFYAQALYGRNKVNGVESTTANQWRLGGRYDRDLSGNVFSFGALDFEKNRLADIKLRTLPSAGVGLHVVRNDVNTFDVFTGLAYNNTNRYNGNDTRATELLFGEESSHKLSATTTFRQKLTIYPSLRDTGEYRAAFDAGLAAAIVAGWSLTVNVTDRYDSNPPPGVKKNDLLVFTGLQYAWGAK